MRITIFLTILISSLLLSGCEQLDEKFGKQSSKTSRYQLHHISEKKVFLLDTEAGALYAVSSEGLHELSHEVPTLEIGQYYKDEDEKFLKYLGNGKFEESNMAILKKWKAD